MYNNDNYTSIPKNIVSALILFTYKMYLPESQIWRKKTRKNCFRYLKLMSPFNAAICTTISYTLWVEWYYLKNNYLTLRSKVITVCNTLPYDHAPTYQISLPISKDKNVMARTRKYYLKTIIWPLQVHYGTRHTALWSCTHIPNIIDLSGKTKKIWFGQASLRRSRSGRTNQTKTICLPSLEGET